MYRYWCFHGPEWVCDVLAVNEIEALAKARHYCPFVDTVERISEAA